MVQEGNPDCLGRDGVGCPPPALQALMPPSLYTDRQTTSQSGREESSHGVSFIRGNYSS